MLRSDLVPAVLLQCCEVCCIIGGGGSPGRVAVRLRVREVK